MERFAKHVAPHALLRSGGAPGADQAFEFGAVLGGGRTEIYLPWNGFQDRWNDAFSYEPSDTAMELAEYFHPRWRYLKHGARKLHARNVHQVLGANCDDPVDLVVCWTKDARGGGGTGQALRVAKHHGVEIWDLADSETRAYIECYAEERP